MSDSYNHPNKRRIHKGIIAMIVVLILTIGGGVAAFVLSNISAKEAYFLAEKNTGEEIKDFFINRYQDELDWNNQSNERPTEQKMEISAEYQGPTNKPIGYSTIDPIQILNNSTLRITAQSDIQEKQIASNLSATIAGIEVDEFNIYITNELLFIGLPFLEEHIQISEEDIGSLLQTLDPLTFTGEESFDFDLLFEENGGLSEEDWKYFYETYFQMIYDQLPDDAFTMEDETLEVNGEKLETDRITLHLTEQQIKDLLVMIIEKMEKDDRLKELLREQLLAGQLGNPSSETEINEIMKEFETALREGKEEIQHIHIKDGFTSTIWTNDKLIVGRDLKIEMGTDENNSVLIAIKGTQLLNGQKQYYDYTIDLADAYTKGTIQFDGELTWDNNQAEDSIAITFGEYQLTYEGSEVLIDGTREFERMFAYEDPFNQGSFMWDGTSTYQEDSMNSEHNFAFNIPELGERFLEITLLLEGSRIDGVEIPLEKEVRDIGKMNEAELYEFIEYDLTPNLQQWLFGFMTGNAGIK